MTHIQIILYHSKPYIPNLIKALNKVKSEKGFFVHYLDNSNEDLRNDITKEKPTFDYTYTISKENLGFGRGHNYIFKKFSKDYKEKFIILNPDIIPFFNFLEKLEVFKIELPATWGIIELTQFPEEHPKDYNEKFETEWASAAANTYKTSVFKKVSGFDEAFFMYGEDIDISWRIREAGYDVYHCPTSRIMHTIAASTRTSEEIIANEDSQFQKVHSLASNLYLRQKYFTNKSVQEYKQIIREFPEYKEVLELYSKMEKRLTQSEKRKFRRYKSPKIYPDTNYAEHRW